MSKTLKVVLSLIVAAVVVSGGYVFSMSKKPALQEKKTYKIGMIAPLTGDVGFVGVGMKNAMLMARDQAGDAEYNFEFVFEDSQYDPKMSASGTQKLINVDKVDAIVSVGYGGPIVSPLATKNDIIHFSISIQPYIAEGDNNFLHWAPSKKLNGLLIKEMQKRGIEKVAVFRTVSLEAWQVYMQDFEEGVKGTGIRIVSDQTFEDNNKDFRNLIAKAKPTNPDIYLLLTQTPALEILAKQMKEAGIKTPMTAIESFEATEETNLFEGYWYVSPVEATHAFRTEYKERFGKKAPVCSPNAYDIFNLLAAAVEKAGSEGKPTTEAIIKELEKTKDFPGALGSLTISNGGIVMSGVQLKMIKGGDHVALSEAE